MLNEKKEYRIDYGGKEVIIETNRLAKQADGSVLVTCGATQVLVTACSAREMKDGQDFFPLLVEYVEKFYSAGKFLGGYMKREARPTTQETLNARLIDRPLRPLFPNGYMFDTVISATVLSYGPDGDPEILAGIGASAALTISDIPFNGPIATCKVGRIDGQLVLNPDYDQWENSDLEIAVAGSADAILMVEGEAKIVPEKEVLEAIFFGHDHIQKFVKVLEQMREEVGKPKREFVSAAANTTMMAKMEDYKGDARACLNINDKMERQAAVRAFEAKIKTEMEANPEAFGLTADDSFKKEAYKGVDELLYKMMRADILDEDKRIAGRGLREVREIETETDVLKTPHGSSLFTRGETQVLATVTMGDSKGEATSDRIVGMEKQKFYLHYNFPPYSVGEARGVRGVGRRELGHGNLAERALKGAFPKVEDGWPYTTRLVCDVLESNGSSSMGSVCSGSMALMDAGVPLKAPVAGVAMGLITDGERFKVLTDILGDEDHLGDMDFKVAGPEAGVTAIQMDIKITGLTREIVEASMDQAREARLHILGEMAKTISTHRPDLKDGAPMIKSFNIKVEDIGALIGPGGKNIKAIQEDFDVNLEVLEDGQVNVLGTNKEEIQNCIEHVTLQINGPEVGSQYDATVVTIKEYGAFVDIAKGVSGLVHISELADERVKDVTDYVAEGDIVKVQVMEYDRMGRLKLSCKAAAPLQRKEGAKEAPKKEEKKEEE